MRHTTMHLDDQVAGEALLSVLAAVKAGDFTARMPLGWTGVPGKVADAVNELVIANQTLDAELARVGEAVGSRGRLSERVGAAGLHGWSRGAANVNALISDLVRPTVEMQRVVGAVAGGDLSKKISSEVRGDTLELKNTINAMVDQLNGFISEVTRVVREVGTEGKLGQAAAVTIEVGGVWKDLTDNVNLMAANLTGQVRNIAEVTTSVANGDLSKKITIDVKGEFLELKNTVNAMVDQLNAFAGEVTRVAREVGVEGKLGGQAQTTEIGGVWKDLTDNVNLMAGNLTNQVRAIAEVATAVTDGDLTRQVRMEARGEVAALKDTLNEMIGNLRETTAQNVEQDWLKTNRERFTRILQGHRDLETVSNLILSELAPLVAAQHGVFYSMTADDDGYSRLRLEAGYGYRTRKQVSESFALGEGLVGQCAKEKKRILMTEVPGDYIRISSGLGEATPLNVIALPILFEDTVRAVVELASFSAFTPAHLAFLDQLGESIGLVLHTIEATTLTEDLLAKAQSMAAELSASNADLGRQAALLAEQNIEAQSRNQEVEESKRMVEEKAGQLLLSSTYKTEFIANMSHELRTPLNSLLMLAEQLEDNLDNNMTETQVEYARVIRQSGNDLLALLNGILDLAKVESGTISLSPADVIVDQLCSGLRSEFTPVAAASGVDFVVDLDPEAPAHLLTDLQRLRQVLRNLITNALKFTEHGEVQVRVAPVSEGWDPHVADLCAARAVVAISVRDTGIGIAPEEQQRIFEPFAQADGSLTRSYGGTGLGLSISRQLITLLGGQITVESTPGTGSTFTVFLPVSDPTPRPATAADTETTDAETAYRPAVVPPPAQSSWARTRPEFETGLLQDTKVLIVDDDYRNLFALTALLERSHAQVTSAESGPAALEILGEREDIDLVLMDIMMPVMDGYATIRAIRQIGRLAELPVIAVTGKVVKGERQRCLDAGANDYVPKPVNTADLLTALSPWLSSIAGAS